MSAKQRISVETKGMGSAQPHACLATITATTLITPADVLPQRGFQTSDMCGLRHTSAYKYICNHWPSQCALSVGISACDQRIRECLIACEPLRNRQAHSNCCGSRSSSAATSQAASSTNSTHRKHHGARTPVIPSTPPHTPTLLFPGPHCCQATYRGYLISSTDCRKQTARLHVPGTSKSNATRQRHPTATVAPTHGGGDKECTTTFSAEPPPVLLPSQPPSLL
jgi:hypothetical protein